LSQRTKEIYDAIYGPRRATQSELAEELGMSQQAISWHVRRALQKLGIVQQQAPRVRIKPVGLAICENV